MFCGRDSVKRSVARKKNMRTCHFIAFHVKMLLEVLFTAYMPGCIRLFYKGIYDEHR